MGNDTGVFFFLMRHGSPMKGIKHWHLVIQKSNSLPQKKDSNGFVVNLQQHRDFVIWLNRFSNKCQTSHMIWVTFWGRRSLFWEPKKIQKADFFAKNMQCPWVQAFLKQLGLDTTLRSQCFIMPFFAKSDNKKKTCFCDHHIFLCKVLEGSCFLFAEISC